jgi:hypothetical protein
VFWLIPIVRLEVPRVFCQHLNAVFLLCPVRVILLISLQRKLPGGFR